MPCASPRTGPYFSVSQIDIELVSGVYHEPHPFCNLLAQKFIACTTVHKGTSFTPTTYNNVKFKQLIIPPRCFTHSNPTNRGSCQLLVWVRSTPQHSLPDLVSLGW